MRKDSQRFRSSEAIKMMNYWHRIIILSLAAFIIGCGPAIQRNPVPESMVEVAQIDGLEDVRFWGDAPVTKLKAYLK